MELYRLFCDFIFIYFYIYIFIYNMSNIKKWFNKAFDFGVNVQILEHTKKEVDGRAVWKVIEDLLIELKDKDLTDYSYNKLKYNMSLKKIYKKMDKIINKFNMDKSEYDPKSNHFFMQLKNLVDTKSNFNIQLNRVAQIGFNAGQLYIFVENNTLPEDRRKKIVNLVLKYKLFELDTYISSDIQDLINKKYLDNSSKLDLRKKSKK